MPTTVQTKITGGAVWMMSFKWAQRGLGFVSMLILVRLLSPADFGLVAMAMSFIALTELLTAFGFDVALIQNQSADVDHYNSAWTANCLLGFVIAMIMVAGAAPVSIFYGQSELVAIVCALAVGPLAAGFENIGIVAFRKELDFQSEFRFQISRKLVGFLATVSLAIVLRSYWALVFGSLASKVFGTILSYRVHPFRPRLSFVQLRSLLLFSRWLLINNFVNFLKERSTDFFVGRAHGPTVLGIYNISYEFANLPKDEIGAPIHRALLPGFSKLSGNSEEVCRTFIDSVAFIALLALPIGAGLFAIAPYMVPIVLGQQWIAAVPTLEILSINSSILVFHGTVATALIALGNPLAVTKTNLVFVMVLILGLTLFSGRYGAIGAAWSVLVACIVTTPVFLLRLRQYVGIRISAFFAAVGRPAFAGIAMALLIRWLMPPYSANIPGGKAVILLFLAIAGGALIYVAAIAVLWFVCGRPPGAETSLVSQIQLQRKALSEKHSAEYGR